MMALCRPSHMSHLRTAAACARPRAARPALHCLQLRAPCMPARRAHRTASGTVPARTLSPCAPRASAQGARAVAPARLLSSSAPDMAAPSSAIAIVERYARPVRWLHWISGAGMISCVGLILAVQQLPAWGKCTPEEKALKGRLMFLHKSMGLLMLGVMVRDTVRTRATQSLKQSMPLHRPVPVRIPAQLSRACNPGVPIHARHVAPGRCRAWGCGC